MCLVLLKNEEGQPFGPRKSGIPQDVEMPVDDLQIVVVE
jgi:hypothetical protein